jgi:hypothetical protein
LKTLGLVESTPDHRFRLSDGFKAV